MTDVMLQSEDEFKKKLTPEQYAVLREKGTERRFRGNSSRRSAKGCLHASRVGTHCSYRTQNSTLGPAGRHSIRHSPAPSNSSRIARMVCTPPRGLRFLTNRFALGEIGSARKSFARAANRI